MTRANSLKYRVAGLLLRLSFRLDREAFNLCGIRPKWRMPQPQTPQPPRPQAILVTGNPVEGLKFHGPVDRLESHGPFATPDWWVAPLHPLPQEAPDA